MSFKSKTISVPLGSIRDGAERISQIAESLTDCVDRMNNAAGAAGGAAWIGDDQAAFVNANMRNQQKFSKIVRKIERQAAYLRSYANTMEEVDNEQAAIIRAVG